MAYYGVIKESKDMNPNCRGFALPSLCYSVLPICRTPEKTNHQYFRNIALQKEKERLRKLELAAAALASTTTTQSTALPATDEPTTTTASTSTSSSTTTTGATTEITATTTTTKTTPQPTETTKLLSTRATTQGLTLSNEQNTQTTQENKIHGNHNDFMTTVKPRLKKSQKSRDRKIRKHSSHQNTAGDGLQHAAASKDSDHHHNNNNNNDDFDERNKRSRRFLSNFWDEHINFENMAEKFRHLRQAMPISHSMIYSPDSNYPPARTTSNLRRICRNECELLENELCQKEYAIAKRHPAIGQVLPIEDCFNLPEELNDCSSLGIAIDVDENEDCYWENGSKYRGKAAVSKSGKPCLTWVRLMKEIADYPELAGTNYCRYIAGKLLKCIIWFQ